MVTLQPTDKHSIFNLSPQGQHTVEIILSVLAAGALTNLLKFLSSSGVEATGSVALLTYLIKLVLQYLPVGA